MLVRSRIPTICDRVVTDYGIAVNPRRQDLQEVLRSNGKLQFTKENR